jgi:hypothetical protein
MIGLTSTPESGGSRNSDVDSKIAAHVATLRELEERLAPESQVTTNNIELAYHQLEFLEQASWGGIDPIVQFCVPLILKHGPQMDPEHMTECITIGCDEFVKKASALILRRTFERRSVGLQEIVDEVYYIKKSAAYSDFRKKLKNNVLYRMRDIGLWNVIEHDDRISKNGVKFHAGFEITAGPVLLAFHDHVYMPYARRRAKVLCKLLQQGEN